MKFGLAKLSSRRAAEKSGYPKCQRLPRSSAVTRRCEPSPAPTKWALSRLGICAPHVRLPIVPLTDAGQVLVESALRDSGLLG